MIVKVLLAIIVLIILALLCYVTFKETVYTAEEAANIQDTFAEFIVERLNKDI